MLFLKFQATFPCSFCQGSNTTMIQISTSVKYNLFDPFLFRPFRYQLPNLFGLIRFGTRNIKRFFTGGCGNQSNCSQVVDDLAANAPIGTKYGQTWFFSCSFNLPTYP